MSDTAKRLRELGREICQKYAGGDSSWMEDDCMAGAAEIERLESYAIQSKAALLAAEEAIDDCLNSRSHLHYEARDKVRAALATILKLDEGAENAVRDRRPDPLGEALNSGDGSYKP